MRASKQQQVLFIASLAYAVLGATEATAQNPNVAPTVESASVSSDCQSAEVTGLNFPDAAHFEIDLRDGSWNYLLSIYSGFYTTVDNPYTNRSTLHLPLPQDPTTRFLCSSFGLRFTIVNTAVSQGWDTSGPVSSQPNPSVAPTLYYAIPWYGDGHHVLIAGSNLPALVHLQVGIRDAQWNYLETITTVVGDSDRLTGNFAGTMIILRVPDGYTGIFSQKGLRFTVANDAVPGGWNTTDIVFSGL